MNDERQIGLEDIWLKIQKLEHHIINMILPFNELNRLNTLLKAPLQIDDRDLINLLSHFKNSIHELIAAIKLENLSKLKDELNPILEASKELHNTLSEIKFIGKRLYEIENKLKEMKENPIKKEVELSFRCDGYELVKKPQSYDETETTISDDENIRKLMVDLSEREKKILIHRLGLFGFKKSTFASIGRIFGITGDRVSQIYQRSLRKLRHPSGKNLFSKVKNQDLRMAIGSD